MAVSFLAYPTVGAFAASRRPKNLVGWTLCGVGLLFGTQGFAIAYAGYALSARPDLMQILGPPPFEAAREQSAARAKA